MRRMQIWEINFVDNKATIICMICDGLQEKFMERQHMTKRHGNAAFWSHGMARRVMR